jgi:hypothetical protein
MSDDGTGVPGRRWDGDTRGVGVAAGTDATPAIEQLLGEMRADTWVTEEPLVHLEPAIRDWLESDGSGRWRLTAIEVEGIWLRIDLEWLGDGRIRDLRADAFALIGSFSEVSTHVLQERTDSAVEFRVATGLPRGRFEPHGHLVRLRIDWESAEH